MIKRTQSLAFRINMLSSAALLCCILIIGSIGIFAVKNEGDRDASRRMNLICDDNVKALNEFLMSVEQSASLVARYAADDISTLELVQGGVIGSDGLGTVQAAERDEQIQAGLDEYLADHTDHVKKLFQESAGFTHGISTYYYRLNPQFSTTEEGFWYAKNRRGSFSPLVVTDLSAYSEEDAGRVSWYYSALRNRELTWMMPYYNENLRETLISCVVPVFKAGTFIGVVGIDINFSTLAARVNTIRLYDSGYAYLTTEDGKIIWHPTLEHTEGESEYDPPYSPVAEVLRGTECTEETTVPYNFRGEKKGMAFNTIVNGMKLVVTAPFREINAEWLRTIHYIILAGLAVLVIFGTLIAFAMRQIITPLKHLTEASRLLAAGKYDVELNYSRSDEVGVLTEAFQKLTEHLRMYISDLNSRAYRDALTGVHNKGAFNIFLCKLNDAAQTAGGNEEPEYAIIVLDCDNLKKINDVYGHEKGDIYLQNACRHICQCFSHSPVFRVGGDEFTVILREEDFQDREALLESFDRKAAAFNKEHVEPWDRIQISKGMAVYDRAQDENAEGVFSRADALMYANKTARKAGRDEADRR